MTDAADIDRVLHAASATERCRAWSRWRPIADGTIYQGAFGRRGLADGAPMTLDTVFWIASMTKAVTGVAAMQCVEQGKLALDQPAGEIMPELAEPQVLEGFDADGKPMTAPGHGARSRLRHLLTHTAGFVYDVWNANLMRYVETTGVPDGRIAQAGIAECAAGLRTRRALGIRHRHRLGRTHGRGRQRPGPGRVYARAYLRAARHARHRLHAERSADCASGTGACTGSRTGRCNRSATRSAVERRVLRRRRRRCSPPAATT